MPLALNLKNQQQVNTSNLDAYLKWIDKISKMHNLNSKIISFDEPTHDLKNTFIINHTWYKILDNPSIDRRYCYLSTLIHYSKQPIINECIQLHNSGDDNLFLDIINGKYLSTAPLLTHLLLEHPEGYYFLTLKIFLNITAWIGNDKSITINFN